MTLDDLHNLTPDDLALIAGAAATRFVEDYSCVVGHVARTTDEYPNGPTLSAVIAAWHRREIPPMPVLEKVIGWVIFMSRLHAKRRALRPDELRARDAAFRLSDAIVAATQHRYH